MSAKTSSRCRSKNALFNRTAEEKRVFYRQNRQTPLRKPTTEIFHIHLQIFHRKIATVCVGIERDARVCSHTLAIAPEIHNLK